VIAVGATRAVGLVVGGTPPPDVIESDRVDEAQDATTIAVISRLSDLPRIAVLAGTQLTADVHPRRRESR
jgi:hypothetical protein